MSDSEDSEESIIEYARIHGLAVEGSLPQLHIDSLLLNFETSLSDDSHLQQIEYKPIPPSDERLTIDEGAARLISDASNGFLDQRTIEKIIAAASTASKPQKLKLELPLLKSDPDADLIAFRQRQYVCVEDENLIYEPLDNERDEGLQWPSRFTDLPKAIIRDCTEERISVLKDTLVHMQAALKDSWTIEDKHNLLHSQSTYKRNPALDPVTPPLSPRCWAVSEAFVPSSPICYLPLLSDPPSLLGADLEATEKAIFEDDGISSVKEEESDCNSHIEHHQTRYRNNYLDTMSLPSDELFPPYEHKTSLGLKIEAPLTPPLPLAKTVTFSDTIEEMLFDGDYADIASSANESRNEDLFFMDDGLYGVFKEAYDTENNKIENEQLQEAATTSKVKVPFMDFTMPDAPWNVSNLNKSNNSLHLPQKILNSLIEVSGLPDCLNGLRNLDNSVGWTVFPSGLAKVVLVEDFGDDNAVLNYITPLEDTEIIGSAGSTYKIPGIRILREIDELEDEDLEPRVFVNEEPDDLASLLKKRKLQLGELTEHGNNEYQDHLKVLRSPTIYSESKLQSRKSSPGNGARSVTVKEMLGDYEYGDKLIGGPFSATMALDNFMKLRGTKRLKLTDSGYFACSKIAPNDESVSMGSVPVPVAPSTTDSSVSQEPIPLPLSSINVPTATTTYIISTELLRQRPLISAVKSLHPGAHFIERDFNKYNTTAWLRQGSIVRSPIINALAAEADLILSPSTGIILTTITKVRQKPLPGQKSKSEIKDRVEAVGRRYERLLVLVGEGSLDNRSTTSLGGQDCMAFAEFMGFCASLPCAVNVFFVPGGVETLANWIVAGMVRFGACGISSPGLLDEETQWEVFLRRCGMNSFAAQAVASAYNAPEGSNQVSSSKRGIFGISAFVEMDQGERLRRLAPILDGDKVLNTVSKVVDTPWRHRTP